MSCYCICIRNMVGNVMHLHQKDGGQCYAFERLQELKDKFAQINNLHIDPVIILYLFFKFICFFVSEGYLADDVAHFRFSHLKLRAGDTWEITT